MPTAPHTLREVGTDIPIRPPRPAGWIRTDGHEWLTTLVIWNPATPKGYAGLDAVNLRECLQGATFLYARSRLLLIRRGNQDPAYSFGMLTTPQRTRPSASAQERRKHGPPLGRAIHKGRRDVTGGEEPLRLRQAQPPPLRAEEELRLSPTTFNKQRYRFRT